MHANALMPPVCMRCSMARDIIRVHYTEHEVQTCSLVLRKVCSFRRIERTDDWRCRVGNDTTGPPQLLPHKMTFVSREFLLRRTRNGVTRWGRNVRVSRIPTFPNALNITPFLFVILLWAVAIIPRLCCLRMHGSWRFTCRVRIIINKIPNYVSKYCHDNH
jgi:hypothetical protein